MSRVACTHHRVELREAQLAPLELCERPIVAAGGDDLVDGVVGEPIVLLVLVDRGHGGLCERSWAVK